MARKEKNTVDYFPHNCNAGQTIFILENRFGNDGYAFWFKILELLGSAENHFIDCRNEETWEFLLAKTRVNEETANNILSVLAKLNTIDKEFWDNKIIWSENFISNLEDVYKRRNSICMQKRDLCKHLSIKCKQETLEADNNVNRKPQSKVKEIKVNESKVNYENFPNLNNEFFIKAFTEWQDYRKETKKILNPSTIKKQLEFLNKQPDPVNCINQSIQNGWQGLFEVKNGYTGTFSKNGGNPNTNGLPPIVGKKYKTAILPPAS